MRCVNFSKFSVNFIVLIQKKKKLVNFVFTCATVSQLSEKRKRINFPTLKRP